MCRRPPRLTRPHRQLTEQDRPAGGRNFGSYSNPQLDALLAQAATVCTDEAARADLYREVERLLIEDVAEARNDAINAKIIFRETINALNRVEELID